LNTQIFVEAKTANRFQAQDKIVAKTKHVFQTNNQSKKKEYILAPDKMYGVNQTFFK